MRIAFPSPEFDDAVAAVCHGSASETEMRALNGLLRSDARARDEYLIRIEVHTRLASDPDLVAQAANAAAHGRTPVVNSEDWRNVLSPNSTVTATRTRMLQMLALATCLVLMTADV